MSRDVRLLLRLEGLAAPVGAAAWWTGAALAGRIALVWAAHIGFDRVLGFGLKLPTGFRDTHLGG